MESRATSPNLHKYNPVCNDSMRLAPMEVARFGHCAVVLDDLIYAIVGSGGVGENWRSIYVLKVYSAIIHLRTNGGRFQI